MAMKEDPDAKHETPVKMNLQERFIRTGERLRTPAAPPPPPPGDVERGAQGIR